MSVCHVHEDIVPCRMQLFVNILHDSTAWPVGQIIYTEGCNSKARWSTLQDIDPQ